MGNPWEIEKGTGPVTKSPTSGKADQLFFSQVTWEPSRYFFRRRVKEVTPKSKNHVNLRLWDGISIANVSMHTVPDFSPMEVLPKISPSQVLPKISPLQDRVRIFLHGDSWKSCSKGGRVTE